MSLRALGRLIKKYLGWDGILFLFGILGILFAVRDCPPNNGGVLLFDFKADIAFAAVSFIAGVIVHLVKMKKQKPAAPVHTEEPESLKSEASHNWDIHRHVTPEEVGITEFIDMMIARLYYLPPVPMLTLQPYKKTASVFDSKLGGTPYLPKGFEYPTGRGKYEGRPLRLLVQLNFEKLWRNGRIMPFPEKGILQIFCSDDPNGLCGADLEDPFCTDGFRVIYHGNVNTDPFSLMSSSDMPEFSDKINDSYFPFHEEYVLEDFCNENGHATADDYRVSTMLPEIYGALIGKTITDIEEMNEEVYNGLFETLRNDKICIGGYPCFFNKDPREDNIAARKADKLLFQLVCTNEDSEERLNTGFEEILNFFISDEDLKKCDFSRVVFSYDT